MSRHGTAAVTAATLAPVLVQTRTEAEWLAARRKGVTASEIAVVMGLSPYDSPFALYHRKRGDLPDVQDTGAMERGRVLEPYIADKFQASHPDLYVVGDGRTLYAHPDRAWQMATPDRLVHDRYPVSYDPLAVLETKTDAGGSEEWGEDGSDQIPVHYRCQVLWQMDVLGVTAAWVACLMMRSWKLRVYEIGMDSAAEDDLDLMKNEADRFLARIANDIPPDPDWRPQTAAALKHLHPSVEDRDAFIPRWLARQYRAACRAHKAAEQRKKLTENLVRGRMESARRARTDDRHGPGEVIATRQVYEVKEHTRRASTVDKLVPAKPPKDAAS